MQKKQVYLAFKIIVALSWWFGFLGLVILVDPELVADIIFPGSYLPFFFLLSMALITSFWVITKSMRKALLITCFTVGQVIFLLWRVWSIWFLMSSFGLLVFVLWIIGPKSAKLPRSDTFTNKSEE